MKVLPQKIISTTRSGTYQYAKVESFSLGVATVRMGINGKGARLTNLNVVGQVNVDDVVVIDYSAGVPYVRSIQNPNSIQDSLEPLSIPLELPAKDNFLDPYSLSTNSVCGTVAQITHSTTFGVPLYTSGGVFYAANANTISTAKVIALGAGENKVLLDGFAKGPWAFTAGGYLFLAVGGGITQTKPTGTDQCVVILGIALTANIIRFKPELVIVELE